VLYHPAQSDITGLLDWEWAGAGEPARDIAWLRWTLRWRGFGELTGLEGYQVYSHFSKTMIDEQFDPALLDAYALARIAAILGGLEPHARGEWLRRAAWTVVQ
jgi:aminoglycoside phosphotransferase (APT) family kinase protein